MPAPLKNGYNIHIELLKKDAEFSMRSSDIYRDFYGASFLVSGDRKTTTPHGIYFSHPGTFGTIPKDLYMHTTFSSMAPYERYLVKFTDQMVEPLIKKIGQHSFDDFMSHIFHPLEEPVQHKIITILEDMLDEYEHYDQHSELLLQGMLTHLLLTVMRNRTINSGPEWHLNTADKEIMQILFYLDLHYQENPSIKDLADIAGLSVSHFSKRFKEAVGSSYTTYLKCYKIRMAQNLLTNTDLSVSDIAMQLGFCNGNYFSNVFHDISGTSPMEFRQYFRKGQSN